MISRIVICINIPFKLINSCIKRLWSDDTVLAPKPTTQVYPNIQTTPQLWVWPWQTHSNRHPRLSLCHNIPRFDSRLRLTLFRSVPQLVTIDAMRGAVPEVSGMMWPYVASNSAPNDCFLTTITTLLSC